MEKINLTREEIVLLIHSVQRTMIKLEEFNDGGSEIVRKHRLLLKTLLDMEQELSNGKSVQPLESYK